MNRQPIQIVTLLATLLVAACGGSSSSTPGTTPPAAASLAVRGTIAARAAGTLTVNGLTIDTTGAQVEIERRQGTETELHRGMKVHVKGTFDRSTGKAKATRVEFGDDMQGRSAADVAAGDDRLTIGGHEVHIEDGTRLLDDRGNDLARGALKKDDRLSVSGFVDDQGRLRASSIQRLASASADDSFEAKGFVVAIAADRKSFDLSLTPGGSVAFNVALASGTLDAAIGVGAFVEAHAPGAAAGTAVSGATVLLDDSKLGEAESEVEVEGIVTSGTSAAFVVASQAVATSGTTRWAFGTSADFAPGVKVEVEGKLDASGTLLADKVSFRDSLRIQGTTSGILTAGAGTITVLGKNVRIDSLTRQDDAYQEGVVFEIRGMPAVNTPGVDLIATRIKKTTSGGGGSRPFIQAVVTAASLATEHLTLLGLDFSTAGATYQNHNQADTTPSIGKDAFYAQVTVGRTVVKAKFDASYTGGAGTAREVELEDEPSGK